MSGKIIKVHKNQPDSHQTQPWCGITFLSFTQKDTVNSTDKQAMSYENRIKVDNYTIVNDIISCNVRSEKSSPLMTAECVLTSGDFNYQAVLAPGDHVLIWMHDDKSHFETVMNAARSNTAANHHDSGLKFVGRINSIRTILQTTSDGKKSLRYLLTFKGFSELQSLIYFNQLLAGNVAENRGDSQQSRALDLFKNLSYEWNNYLFQGGSNSQSSQKLIDFFIDVFLGRGPTEEGKNLEGTKRSPNDAFLVPKELLTILGLKPSKDRPPNYSDMLHTILGIQKYSNGQYLPNVQDNPNSAVQRETPNPIYGNMLGLPDSFNNVSLWSLLQQHSNPALNEMYTTLRMNSKGNIVPTYICRQIPFSTKYLGQKLKAQSLNENAIQYTKFTELPTWEIDPALLYSFNLGTTDAARFNFFQIYGQMFGLNALNPADAQQAQIKAGNVSIDAVDISRHGVRTMVQTVAADFQAISGTVTDIKYWKELVSDWYANGHLKLNGSLSMAGVYEPICIGDNLKIDNKVLHIEGIEHSYRNEHGHKRFDTNISLSHGVLVKDLYVHQEAQLREALQSPLLPGYTDEERYINGEIIVSTPGKKK